MTFAAKWAHEYHGCPPCHDTKSVISRGLPVECPACGGMDDGVRAHRKSEAWRIAQKVPSISSEIDLTPAEYVVFKDWRARFPDYAKSTLFAWIEGLRYDPAKDPIFLTECEAELVRWRSTR